MYTNINYLQLTTLFFTTILFSLFLITPTITHAFYADEAVDLDGYAWSGTIGWISLGGVETPLSEYVLEMATGLHAEDLTYDVDNNGSVTSFDALEISRVENGLEPQSSATAASIQPLIDEWGADEANRGNAQVTINTDGTVTGYGWSPHIGWVRFGGLDNFPTGGGTTASNAYLADVGSGNYELRGWARACAATPDGDCVDGFTAAQPLSEYVLEMAMGMHPEDAKYDVDNNGSVTSFDALEISRVENGLEPQSSATTASIQPLIDEWEATTGSLITAGGWDGWIALSGNSHSVRFNSAGPVSNSYAWGSTVVGWIDMFSHVSYFTDPTPDPSANITVSGCTVTLGFNSCDTGSLDWTINNASNPSVHRTNPDTATISTSETGSVTGLTMLLNQTYTYEARNGSEVLDTDEVTIECADSNARINVAGVCACEVGYRISAGACILDPDADPDITDPDADPTIITPLSVTGSLTINPLIVRRGQDVEIEWTTSGATVCALTHTQGSDDIADGGTYGSESVTINSQNQVIFTLACDGIEVDRETVRVLPTIFES